ncbi:mitochondrial inner membrane protease ATP23 homolog isoform X2 [Arvicola amphibius]|uniref:mitochondrial inner membrane protease ATP23 homolog isoform X2 n=1 Tax=Arvicola amphibius TaxID=1047088 RepID=UPI0018E2A6EB|nr:mitochondrial inner membrane protease ATP23 homolog isoform X2 [Arvicola amphibius]
MAGAPGGGGPGPAAGEPLLQRRDSGLGSPEPPAHGKPQQGFLSSFFTRDQSCPLMLQKTLETNPYVKVLLDAMKHSGCAVNKGRHFSCEDCDGNVSGGFDAAASQPCSCARCCKYSPPSLLVTFTSFSRCKCLRRPAGTWSLQNVGWACVPLLGQSSVLNGHLCIRISLGTSAWSVFKVPWARYVQVQIYEFTVPCL